MLLSMNSTNFRLTYAYEGNAVVFRVNGVLLERFLSSTRYGLVSLGVQMAMRRYHPALRRFSTLGDVWRKMHEDVMSDSVQILTECVIKDIRLLCCKEESSYSLRVLRNGFEDVSLRTDYPSELRARIAFERRQEGLAGEIIRR